VTRWWFILLAVVLGWFTPAHAFAHTRTPQGEYDVEASLEKVVSVAGITMDTYQGNTQDPLSLHKYLYCEANPVDNDDPLGLYTPDEGGAMERLIGADYSEAHPMADVTYGQWTRIGKNPQLKPDIFNKTDKTYADIKPLSLGGLYGGIEQLESYDNSLKNLNYTREQWPANSFAPLRTVFYNFAPYFYFNVDGIIFYTRIDPGFAILPISITKVRALAVKQAEQLLEKGATTFEDVAGKMGMEGAEAGALEIEEGVGEVALTEL